MRALFSRARSVSFSAARRRSTAARPTRRRRPRAWPKGVSSTATATTLCPAPLAAATWHAWNRATAGREPCVKVADGSVCQFPDETHCMYSSMCPDPLEMRGRQPLPLGVSGERRLPEDAAMRVPRVRGHGLTRPDDARFAAHQSARRMERRERRRRRGFPRRGRRGKRGRENRRLDVVRFGRRLRRSAAATATHRTDHPTAMAARARLPARTAARTHSPASTLRTCRPPLDVPAGNLGDCHVQVHLHLRH